MFYSDGLYEYGRFVMSSELEGLFNKVRAGVLGANDGIVSVAGVIVGVAAAGIEFNAVVVAGVAALVSGAISMAGGEYVSVSAQRDAELGHGRQKHELAASPFVAAVASFVSFLIGGLLPILGFVGVGVDECRVPATILMIVVALSLTGLLAARVGKSSVWTGIRRNVGVSVLTMGASYGVGLLLGAAGVL